MFKNKVYKLYNIILTLYIPIMLLVTSLIENITYDKTNDQGGWGGLILTGCIIVSIIWFLIILFINYIVNSFAKTSKIRKIYSIGVSILNLLIYLCHLNFFGNMNEFICIVYFLMLIIYIIFINVNKEDSAYKDNNGNNGVKIKINNKFLKFDNKIIPLIIYALVHIIAWHLGKYISSSVNFLETSYDRISFVIIIVWGIYYFINTIKNNRYVTKLELIIYNIFNIINAVSLSNFAVLEDVGFGGPGMAAIMAFLFSLIPIVYLLILNLILYIRVKNKKCIVNAENKNKLRINFVSVIFYIIICVSPFLYGYIGNKRCESKALNISIDYLIKEYGNKEYKLDKEKCDSYECYFTIKTEKEYEIFSVNINKDTFKIMYTEELKCLDDESCLNASKNIAIEYMNNKYAEEKFELVDAEQEEFCSLFDCYKNGYLVTMKSDTLNENFVVSLDNNFEILDEEFTFLYFSQLTNSYIYDYYDLVYYLEQHMTDKLDKEIMEKYNIVLTEKNIYIDIDKLEKANYKKLPTLEDLEDLVEIDNIKFTINKEFKSSQKEDCVEYIKDFLDYLCKNYNIEGENSNIMIDYAFSYDNPFTTNKFYIDGGYIRVTNKTYDIYLDATPTIVNRK